jgi:aspartate kinase
MTLDPKAFDTRDKEELEAELSKIASVQFSGEKAIISLVSNVSRSTEILARAMQVLWKENINVEMISQGASKFNISFIVEDNFADSAVKALHKEFFHQ